MFLLVLAMFEGISARPAVADERARRLFIFAAIAVDRDASESVNGTILSESYDGNLGGSSRSFTIGGGASITGRWIVQAEVTIIGAREAHATVPASFDALIAERQYEVRTQTLSALAGPRIQVGSRTACTLLAGLAF